MNDPRIGQRVRFTRTDHVSMRTGTCGTIAQVAPNERFFVAVDDGGWFGWTSFDSWESTGEPDVVLPADYLETRMTR